MEWNEGMIRNLFSEEAVSMILQIPLSLRSPHDSLFWYPTSDGLFTVRLAYWLGKLGHEDWRQVGAFDRAQRWWRDMGKRNILPKIKHFAGKACNGFMATNETLWRRHTREIVSCTICNHPNETILHATLECNLARSVWDNGDLDQLIQAAPKTAFIDFVSWVENSGRKQAADEVLTLAWAC